ncbi:MAG: hypothetical protein H6597_03320 [Flavobacteriales bacterium]|nr:hypothetical protein [Flavobacteriales bacterium]MCB9193537.1 hypothetical protein [Flavobacteriales bacterium]
MNTFRTLLPGALACLLGLPTLSFGQNDLCSGALPIACGQTVSGNTTSASADPDACVGNNTAPGVWYTFTGANSNDPGAATGSAGDYIFLSTCGSSYDTKIDVFEGTCGALTCVAGNDDTSNNGCFGGSRIVFPTTVGTTYYVLISGKDATDFGAFNLAMTCGTGTTGSVVQMPQTGMNYVPCGTNATLQDAGGAGNYLDNSAGYTVLEASAFSTIHLSGNWVFDDEQIDYLVIYAGSGLETVLLSTANSGTINVTAPMGEPVIVYFNTDNVGTAAGLNLNVSWSGPCAPDPNQTCAQASPITCGQTISGTTHWATTDAIACVGNNTAPGVWYTFTGANSNAPGAPPGSTGDHIFLSTCGSDYDTKIDVFEGSCGALTCVAGNDDTHPFMGCSNGSRVFFPTTVGTTYSILVSGKDASASGNFELTMDCAPAQGGPVVLVPQTGAKYVPCGTSVVLRDAGNLGNYPDNANGYTILEATNNSAITLSGNVVFDGEQVDQLAIYTGTGLETLEATYYNSGAVNFTGQPGESVIVFFYSDNFSNAAGFNLNVTWSGACVPVPNEFCTEALPITCGATVNGFTMGASGDGAPTCFGGSNLPGVWYTFTGANSNDPLATVGTPGDVVTLKACTTGSIYSAQLEVFEGDCNSLTCIVGGNTIVNYVGCDYGSEVSLNTTVGTTYYVLVSIEEPTGYSAFDLSLTCEALCTTMATNGVCTGAEPIPVTPYGTQSLTLANNLCVPLGPFYSTDCSDPTMPNSWSTWHSFTTGSVGNVHLDLETISAYGLFAEVYTACGGTTSLCAEGALDISTTFNLQPFTSYLLRVGCYAANTRGHYMISLAEANLPPANDNCSGAVPLLCGQVVNASTAGVVPDTSSCFGTVPSQGLWYTITGWNTSNPQAAPGSVGDLVELRTCGDAGFDTRIDVFEGSCGALTCVTSSDDGYAAACGANKSRATFQSVVGTTYYILVTGTDDAAFGAFELTVDCGQVSEMPVARIPPDAINYVPCGTNVTLRDWGNLGNYLNNSNGYTVLQASHTATVTLSGSYSLDGDDHLAVFHGVGMNDLVAEYFGSGTINFTGLPGEPITVLFYSDAANTAQGFDLNVTYGGNCVLAYTLATPIACGSTLSGTTVGASDDDAPTCFGGSNLPGKWYTFTGENSSDPLAAISTPGDLVTLNACPTNSNYRTQIEVFDGVGSSLNCIVGSSVIGGTGGCYQGSEVSLNTTVGATYYVLVSFVSPTASGTFDLTMTCDTLCATVPANGVCSGALVVPLAPYGTTSFITDDNSCVPLGDFYSALCGSAFPNSWGTWYTFTTSSSGRVAIDIVPLTTQGSMHWEVRTACGVSSTTCSPGLNQTAALLPNTTYWMRVGTYTAQSRGTYQISLAEGAPPPPANDHCAGAIPITIGTPVAGTNAWATTGPDELAGGCSFFSIGGTKGVWYTLAGVDGMMSASTCNDGYSSIRVLSGSCGNLSCVEAQLEPCGFDGYRVTWAGSADSTYYLVVGTCCGNASGGAFTLLVEQDVRIGIQPKVFLQGPYDPGTGLMRDDLRANFLIPQIYGNGYMVYTAMYPVTGPDALVDWVTVELRDAADGQTVVASKDVLVQSDGSMISDHGVSFQTFNASPGNYYVAVHHRNHLSVMSATPIALGGVLDTIDFTDGSTATYGTDAQVDINGVKAMWCGDVNGDGVIKYTGGSNDRDEVLQVIGGVIPTNTTSGRYDADVNLDGQVKYTGANNDRDMILQNIGGTIPTATRNEQMP